MAVYRYEYRLPLAIDAATRAEADQLAALVSSELALEAEKIGRFDGEITAGEDSMQPQDAADDTAGQTPGAATGAVRRYLGGA